MFNQLQIIGAILKAIKTVRPVIEQIRAAADGRITLDEAEEEAARIYEDLTDKMGDDAIKVVVNGDDVIDIRSGELAFRLAGRVIADLLDRGQ